MAKHTFSLGNMSEARAKAVKQILDGKTFYNFRVHYGIMAGGCPVEITTDYDCEYADAAEMIMHVMASGLASGDGHR